MIKSFAVSALVCVSLVVGLNANEHFLNGAKRVVVLGDSITYSGQYVAFLEAFWRIKNPDSKIEFINLGLPSETVSGLSEMGHAGGRFPRPDLHERIDRILEKTKPDLIIACYGMNCGIYRPYADDRFDAFRKGIVALRAKAKKAGASVVHLTPPSFDVEPIRARTVSADSKDKGRMYTGYNEVLDLYSAWLLANRGKNWIVIDAHQPMNQFLQLQRAKNAKYRLAGDGVHINEVGHWLVAREILRQLDFDAYVCSQTTGEKAFNKLSDGKGIDKSKKWSEYIPLIKQRQRLEALAWLTETGHKRPGIPKGLSIDDARIRAAEIENKIEAWLKR